MPLSLTRKNNEGVWIEIEGIEPIHIVTLMGHNRVRLSITADEENVKIYRDEVYVRVLQERLNHQTPEKETDRCPALPPPPSSNNS